VSTVNRGVLLSGLDARQLTTFALGAVGSASRGCRVGTPEAHRRGWLDGGPCLPHSYGAYTAVSMGMLRAAGRGSRLFGLRRRGDRFARQRQTGSGVWPTTREDPLQRQRMPPTPAATNRKWSAVKRIRQAGSSRRGCSDWWGSAQLYENSLDLGAHWNCVERRTHAPATTRLPPMARCNEELHLKPAGPFTAVPAP
jgi:hypothetical protein